MGLINALVLVVDSERARNQGEAAELSVGAAGLSTFLSIVF